MRYNIIEDCLKVVPNKFELVVLASQRAYNLSSGSKPTVDHLKSDRVTVIALSEIANSTLDFDALYKDVFQRDNKAKKGADDFMVERSVLDWTDMTEDDGVSFDSNSKSNSAGDAVPPVTDVIFDNDVD